MNIALIVFSLIVPIVALLLVKYFAWARFFGPVVIACAFGIAFANQPFITFDESTQDTIRSTAKLISSAAIPLAIPLLLFQSELNKIKAHGKTILLSFVIAVLSVFLGVLMVATAMKDQLSEAGPVAGMIMSVYIGGLPNLVAVQQALQANDFIAVQAATTAVSAVYFIFLLTVAKPLLRRFFPAHPSPEPMGHISEELEGNDPQPLWSKKHLIQGGLSILASIICVAISAGITFLIVGKDNPQAFSLGSVLGITTLALVASFIKPLRQIPTHEPIGMFLILIFCFSAGTMANISELVSTGGTILQLTALSVLAFLPIHYIGHRLFKIDIDTTMTMSVATMFGPPFIPAVVQAVDNRSVLVPCMVMGFLGYAVGTYLGIAVGLYF